MSSPKVNRKKVYIMYVGGTIGMKKTPQGYAPEKGFLMQEIQNMDELHDARMPQFDIKEYVPLLDSSDIDHEDWKTIALDLEQNYEKYDGFVVLHGTDTMSYTASALSFMLHNLNKIVVVTGAQIPLSEIRNDARYNLISSIMIAGNFPIPEVCLFFNDQLMRGNRTKKIDITGLKAFESPNYPPLATVGIDIEVFGHRILRKTDDTTKLIVRTKMSKEVISIRMFPGLSAKMIHDMLKGTSIKGLVIEAYGSGNLPEKKQDLLNVLEEYIKKGVIVIIISQTLRGTVNMDTYKTGAAFKNIGVLSGYDMTEEAAIVKLQFLLGQDDLKLEDVKELMKTNMAGELSPPSALSRKYTQTTIYEPPEMPHNFDKDFQMPLSYHPDCGYFRHEVPEHGGSPQLPPRLKAAFDKIAGPNK